MNGKYFFALAASWSLLGFARAHIHSQKVNRLKRSEFSADIWLYALVSSALVGACGILPLLLSKWIRLENASKNSLPFKVVLSFAVGGLLGDVFLHLLPEAYGAHHLFVSSDREAIRQKTFIGLWVILGVLAFLVVEKMMLLSQDQGEGTSIPVTESVKWNGRTNLDNYCVITSCVDRINTNSNCNSLEDANGTFRNSLEDANGTFRNSLEDVNGISRNSLLSICNRRKEYQTTLTTECDHHPQRQRKSFTARLSHVLRLPLLHSIFSSPSSSSSPPSRWLDKDASGYLNLVANCTDNFTHGLAIAAGYVVSPAVGVLTTIAILCHEVPHEVGDFVILLNSGFSWKEAAKAQMLTACGGFVGVVVGLTAEHVTSASGWLLPFTAGGFLYIALVSIVPDLLVVGSGREGKEWRHSITEMFAMGVGMVVMALVTIVEKKSCEHVPSHLT